MEKKKYICRWGDWDERALNTYDDREKEVTQDYFTDQNGYDEEDINAIDMLEVGEQYDVGSGNQIVERIK
ncbi:hypothetical protein [Pontibacter mangrovi]|uniref:Uncharacterized protein n=1 Tax=Pontibacter mangrovi TaxID=2589816 RepID=A0A501W7P2_9BACT|nr:hypothetical protein [Pontibacter mangrovi]TPE43271.1 hypothetical protein FJM65_14260 [Pontibacter mangrovi]